MLAEMISMTLALVTEEVAKNSTKLADGSYVYVPKKFDGVAAAQIGIPQREGNEGSPILPILEKLSDGLSARYPLPEQVKLEVA